MQWYQMRFEANFWLLHLLLLGIIRQQTIDASLIESRDGYLRSSTQNYYQRSKITVDNFSKKSWQECVVRLPPKIGLYFCEGYFKLEIGFVFKFKVLYDFDIWHTFCLLLFRYVFTTETVIFRSPSRFRLIPRVL